MDFTTLLDALVSHAQSVGGIAPVNGHQPPSVDPSGISAGIWVQDMRPVKELSGLSVTSMEALFNVRLYSSAVQQPYDAIDPALMNAADTLLAAYSGDFQLAGEVMEVDLLGQYGPSMSATAGYMTNDGVTLRVMTIALPLIVADLWKQGGS
jgi:hypothetical protein